MGELKLVMSVTYRDAALFQIESEISMIELQVSKTKEPVKNLGKRLKVLKQQLLVFQAYEKDCALAWNRWNGPSKSDWGNRGGLC